MSSQEAPAILAQSDVLAQLLAVTQNLAVSVEGIQKDFQVVKDNIQLQGERLDKVEAEQKITSGEIDELDERSRGGSLLGGGRGSNTGRRGSIILDPRPDSNTVAQLSISSPVFSGKLLDSTKPIQIYVFLEQWTRFCELHHVAREAGVFPALFQHFSIPIQNTLKAKFPGVENTVGSYPFKGMGWNYQEENFIWQCAFSLEPHTDEQTHFNTMFEFARQKLNRPNPATDLDPLQMDYMPFHVEMCRALNRIVKLNEALKKAVEGKDGIVPGLKKQFQAPEDMPNGVKRGTMVDLILMWVIPDWFEYLKSQISHNVWSNYSLTQATEAIIIQSQTLANTFLAVRPAVIAYVRKRDDRIKKNTGARGDLDPELKHKLAIYADAKRRVELDQLGHLSEIKLELDDLEHLEGNASLPQPEMGIAQHLVEILGDTGGIRSQLIAENDADIVAFVQTTTQNMRPYVPQSKRSSRPTPSDSSKNCADKPCMTTLKSVLEKEFSTQLYTTLRHARMPVQQVCVLSTTTKETFYDGQRTL